MDSIQVGNWPDEPPRTYQLIEIIRSLAASSRLVLLDHAEERMYERDIDMNDIMTVLRIGEIVGPVEPGRQADEWQCKVTASPDLNAGREIGVVTIVMSASRLLIKTVEWED